MRLVGSSHMPRRNPFAFPSCAASLLELGVLPFLAPRVFAPWPKELGRREFSRSCRTPERQRRRAVGPQRPMKVARDENEKLALALGQADLEDDERFETLQFPDITQGAEFREGIRTLEEEGVRGYTKESAEAQWASTGYEARTSNRAGPAESAVRSRSTADEFERRYSEIWGLGEEQERNDIDIRRGVKKHVREQNLDFNDRTEHLGRQIETDVTAHRERESEKETLLHPVKLDRRETKRRAHERNHGVTYNTEPLGRPMETEPNIPQVQREKEFQRETLCHPTKMDQFADQTSKIFEDGRMQQNETSERGIVKKRDEAFDQETWWHSVHLDQVEERILLELQKRQWEQYRAVEKDVVWRSVKDTHSRLVKLDRTRDSVPLELGKRGKKPDEAFDRDTVCRSVKDAKSHSVKLDQIRLTIERELLKRLWLRDTAFNREIWWYPVKLDQNPARNARDEAFKRETGWRRVKLVEKPVKHRVQNRGHIGRELGEGLRDRDRVFNGDSKPRSILLDRTRPQNQAFIQIRREIMQELYKRRKERDEELQENLEWRHVKVEQSRFTILRQLRKRLQERDRAFERDVTFRSIKLERFNRGIEWRYIPLEQVRRAILLEQYQRRKKRDEGLEKYLEWRQVKLEPVRKKRLHRDLVLLRRKHSRIRLDEKKLKLLRSKLGENKFRESMGALHGYWRPTPRKKLVRLAKSYGDAQMYAGIFKQDGLQMAQKYKLLEASGTPMHRYYRAQFVHHLARKGATATALRALVSLHVKRASFKSPHVMSLCSTLLQSAFVPENRPCIEEGDIPTDLQMFDWMVSAGLEPNCIIYNILIMNAEQRDDPKGAFGIYEEMKERGIEPDEYTYSILINNAKRRGDMESVKAIFQVANEKHGRSQYLLADVLHSIYVLNEESIKKLRLETQEEVPQVSALKAMFGFYRQFFFTTPFLDLIPPHRAASQLADFYPEFLENQPEERSEAQRMEPCAAVLNIMLVPLLRRVGNPEEVVEYYEHFKQLVREDHPAVRLLADDTHVYDTFLMALGQWEDTLGTCAELLKFMMSPPQDDSKQHPQSHVLERQKLQPTVRSWSILLKSFMMHHQPRAAEKVLKMMEARGIVPTDVTWHSLIAGYAKLQDIQSALDARDRMMAAGYLSTEKTESQLGWIEDRDALHRMRHPPWFSDWRTLPLTPEQPDTGILNESDVDDADQPLEESNPGDASAEQPDAELPEESNVTDAWAERQYHGDSIALEDRVLREADDPARQSLYLWMNNAERVRD